MIQQSLESKIAVSEAQASLVFQEALVLLTTQMFSDQFYPLVSCVANTPMLSPFFSLTCFQFRAAYIWAIK